MRALITGITGQDGSYLAEFLLEKGYEVVGVTRGKTTHKNVAAIEKNITWAVGDIANREFVRELLTTYTPDEVYNPASIATVQNPWDDVRSIAQVTGLTPLHFLEGIQELAPKTRFFQASSAEMFGQPDVAPQSELTPLKPHRPYGIAKTFAHHFVRAYREQQGIFVVSGILYNHESPRRPTEFITRKITHALANIKLGHAKELTCGNLEARRDWGYAKEYVEAMWLMLQQEEADDYVLATGKTHSVREVIELASQALNMPITWEGEGTAEVGRNAEGDIIVRIEEKWYRAPEPVELVGDVSHAKEKLGWIPQTSFKELIRLMAEEDYRALTAAVTVK